MNQVAFESLHRERWANFVTRLESLERRRAPGASDAATPGSETSAAAPPALDGGAASRADASGPQEAWPPPSSAVAASRAKAKSAPVPPSSPDLGFPAQYRRLCHDLALARHRRYDEALLSELNGWVLRGYRQLYIEKEPLRVRLASAMFAFPRALRAEPWTLWLATALFLVPAVGAFLLVWLRPDWTADVMDPAMADQMAQMYNPSSPDFLRQRESSSDVMMFGYYIFNNIGIAFRTFASGIFFGVGSLFVIVFNGLLLGAAAAHVTNLGFANTFFPFVIAHGSFELTAIVIAGVAGLRLGRAVLMPQRLSRAAALAATGREVMPLLLGMTAMLLLAAFVEAFWSSKHHLPLAVRFGVGGVLWVLVFAYLALGGREREG